MPKNVVSFNLSVNAIFKLNLLALEGGASRSSVLCKMIDSFDISLTTHQTIARNLIKTHQHVIEKGDYVQNVKEYLAIKGISYIDINKILEEIERLS